MAQLEHDEVMVDEIEATIAKVRKESREKLRFEVRRYYDLQRTYLATKRRNKHMGKWEPPASRELVKRGSNTERLDEDILLEQLARVTNLIEGVPIYEEWLRKVKGIGPMISAVLMAEYDIHLATTVSKLWKYGGLAVIDGKADLPAKGRKLQYNPFLQTKLVAVLGQAFLKSNSPYRKHYDDRKGRQQAAGWGNDDGHRHADATRFMVKRFLADLYVAWREMEGLPVRAPYAEEYLGKKHAS